MAEFVNAYAQKVPALRLIGKKYGPADWVNGSFAHKWAEWWPNGWFDQLESRYAANVPDLGGDEGAYVGAFIMKGQAWEYWIGILFQPGAEPMEGFEALDLPEGEMKVAWVKGKENGGDLYGQEEAAQRYLAEKGLPVQPRADGMFLSLERYQCPRFTNPDEQGNVILDLCFY